MNAPFIPPDLLKKYLNGTASEAEREIVEAWYDSLRHSPDYLGTLPDIEQKALREETFRAISERLNTRELNNVRALPTTYFRSRSLWAVASAVAAVILLTVGIGLWLNHPVHQPTNSSVAVNNSSYIHFVNKQARIVQKRLPDGTVVWLHPLAELHYPTVFPSMRRDVDFAGEAFFDVAKDASRPFRIRSGKMQVQVLGTSFNVKATPRQALFEVAVVTGKVVVSSVAQHGPKSVKTVTLLPHQEALYNVSTDRLTFHEQILQARQEFYQPVSIAFADTPIKNVLTQLEGRFKVSFRVSNPALYHCRLTANFTQQSLADILDLLCISLDATYTLSGDTIMLEGDGCS
ncbi:FecR family protein [Spirosoma panaciterrae]|uniref:FecR family protein n=1 Tax=Spirosoma panaciterrae TaxID=496058 RepID=UPI000373460B|nr:FecR family protein [Spirosoma panaciterrae]